MLRKEAANLIPGELKGPLHRGDMGMPGRVKSSGVKPSALVALTLAPAWSKSAAMFVRPANTAKCSAVFPDGMGIRRPMPETGVFGFAPNASSTAVDSVMPRTAA